MTGDDRPVPAAPAPGPVSAALAAVAEAWRVDRSGLQPLDGLRAAVALAGAMAVGLVIGGPVDAVLAGAGALVVGSASLPSGTGVPLGTTVGAALAVAVSTFVGAASGPVEAVHIAMLVVWCLAAGMMVALGPSATTVGVQAVVGMVVLGRFGGPVGASGHLALVVLGGAAAQVGLAIVVRRLQGPAAARRLVASLYRALADQARGLVDDVAVAEAADTAERHLLAAAVGGRTGASAAYLRSLVAEGRRIRRELLAEPGRHRPGALPQAGVPAVAPLLDEIALTVVGARRWSAAPIHPGTGEALAGQLRAAQSMAAELPAVRRVGRARRPDPPGVPSPPGVLAPPDAGGTSHPPAAWTSAMRRRLQDLSSALFTDLATLRAGMAIDAPAWRHALRLAVVVPGADLLASGAGLPHGYWVALTAALVLKPDYGSTVGRGAARALGTGLGVIVAGLLTATLHPSPPVTIAVVALLAAAAYSVFRASYTLFSALLTAVVVFLLGSIEPGGLPLALDRLADTAVGAALALVAYVAWPTWSAPQAVDRLAALVDAQRRYLVAVLAAWGPVPQAGGSGADRLAASRAARQATGAAVVAVRRSLAEPPGQRVDGSLAVGLLDALRRVTVSAAVLRSAADQAGDGTLPAAAQRAVADLATELDGRLAAVAAGLRRYGAPGAAAWRGRPTSGVVPAGGSVTGAVPSPVPPLRQAQRTLARCLADHNGGSAGVLASQTDALVDAVNTAAALVGSLTGDAQGEPDRRRSGGA